LRKRRVVDGSMGVTVAFKAIGSRIGFRYAHCATRP
jgi:hypothetical protein